jgi:hypothetical protein
MIRQRNVLKMFAELIKFLEETRLEKEKYNFVRASGDCVCTICGKNTINTHSQNIEIVMMNNYVMVE